MKVKERLAAEFADKSIRTDEGPVLSNVIAFLAGFETARKMVITIMHREYQKETLIREITNLGEQRIRTRVLREDAENP
jgi:hypothetical protein